MDGAQLHLLKHTLTNANPSTLGASLQNELTRQLKLDKEKKHRSFSWKLLWTIKGVFQATKYQGDTALIPPLSSHPSSKTQEEERKESGEKKSRLHNQWS